MSLNINGFSVGNDYEHNVSKITGAEKKDESENNNRAVGQMTDTVHTSSWARMASGALTSARNQSQTLRQDRVDQFAFMAEKDEDGPSAWTADEMADSIFSRIFG